MALTVSNYSPTVGPAHTSTLEVYLNQWVKIASGGRVYLSSGVNFGQMTMVMRDITRTTGTSVSKISQGLLRREQSRPSSLTG